jgi:anti-sigma B factor antagonist
MGRYSRNQRDALTISTVRIGAAVVVTVGGEIDMYTVHQLRAELSRVVAEPPGGPIFLDMTAVTFIGSAGLAVLVETQAKAQHQSRPFGLVVDHFATAVVQPLQAAGLASLFTTYSDVAEAVAQSQ